MDLSDFKLRQLVFEVRYAEAYLLWDCTGRIHRELAELWPGTTLGEVAPNHQALTSETVSIVTGIASARIILARPATIVQHSDKISETVRIWVERLEISEFTRVGTRLFYDRSYGSEDEAKQAAVELGLAHYPEAPIFNHKERPYAAEVRLLWRDDVSQTQFHVKTERHQLEIGGSPESPLPKETRVSDHLVLDIDRATRGVVEISKFRVSEWLSGVRHLVSRDVPKLLKTAP